MKFETEKHYTRKSIIKDWEISPLKVELTHWANPLDISPYAIITIDTGACHIHAKITAAEARALASNLLGFAEEVEAHQTQLTAEEVAA